MRGQKRIVGMITGLVALMGSTSVLALCGGCMSVPCGWYVEANAGYSTLSNTNLPGKVDSNGAAGNLNIGYKFMPYVGLEIGYSQYSGSSINDIITGEQAGKAKHYSYDIAGRAIWPIADSGFELFGKIGAQHIATTVSLNRQNPEAIINTGLTTSMGGGTTGLYMGLGGQYYLMPELAVVVQWQRAAGNGSTGTADLYSGGLSFIFD